MSATVLADRRVIRCRAREMTERTVAGDGHKDNIPGVGVEASICTPATIIFDCRLPFPNASNPDGVMFISCPKESVGSTPNPVISRSYH